MALQKTPLTPSPANVSAPAATKTAQTTKPVVVKTQGVTSTPFWIGLLVSIAWVAVVVAAVIVAGPSNSFAGVALADWAVGISAAVSPVAMVWMVTAYLQRASDIQSVSDPLRRQLTLITGESGAADARIRRFNQALREQIDLLRNAQTVSQEDLESIMDRMRQHKSDLERFENVSAQQVKEIQDVVRRSMFQIEQMMDDKFTMLRVLDGKLQQNGDGVARQVESVGEQVARMLEEVERSSAQITDALDRASRDSQKLADTSKLQEASLTSAAEAASETLGGLSSKIDLSVARFLERASSAREEAERLAHALDAQTRALDDFTTTLPSRVSEAESILRGVADRLYSSEQLAREQALSLSEKLSLQVDGLQGFMDRFTGRLAEIDGGLNARQSDLNGLADRIGTTASSFMGAWEKSVSDLNDRTGNTLLRFSVVNDEARRNADSIVANLAETTGKYEDVVLRMRALTNDSGAKMKEMTEDVARHLEQFETLSAASNKAGGEVQARAAVALENLQKVLERVMAAREATQGIGENLVKDINEAVNQNEKLINRLKDTAQIGVVAITAASENLTKHQSDLASNAIAGEASVLEAVQRLQQQAEAASNGLRGHTDSLKNLLSEAQGQLDMTEQKMQNFATKAVVPVQAAVQQIDASAERGLKSIGAFGEGVSAQVNRLQDFNSRIGVMSEDMAKAAAESASAFAALGDRFATLRVGQEEMAKNALAQFSDLSDRLQREISGLDGQAASAADLLQQAALKVGEQSYQMMEKAQGAGAHIKEVAASLQAEADHIQALLRKQNEEIGSDLARAEQRFSDLGQTIKMRADSAHELLDRVASHYGEVTQTLDKNIEVAHVKMEGLNSVLSGCSDKIMSDAEKISKHSCDISSFSETAIRDLSDLSNKMFATYQAAETHSKRTVATLDETTAVFQGRANSISEAARGAVEAVAKAGDDFGNRATRLAEEGMQVDKILRQITQATTTLTDQASSIRQGMEQQNNSLLMQLKDSIVQMESAGSKLQQVISSSMQGADRAALMFTDMTDTSSGQISAATKELQAMADRAGSALSVLGANVTQQAASLAVVGDQIGEQQKMLTLASETQRKQMADLFDKLKDAHSQASQIAEKSISHLSMSLEEISRQISTVESGTQNAVGTVKAASIGFTDQSTLLLQNAKAAEQQARTILQVTSSLQEQARQLRESLVSESERAGETLGTLLSRMSTGGEQVRELGLNTKDIFSSIQNAMSVQTTELTTAMDKMGERQRTMTVALEQQREVIGHLLSRLTAAQDETATAAERASSKLVEGTLNISRVVEDLDGKAQSALSSVQSASAGFAYEVEAIERHARQADVQAKAIASSAAEMQGKISDLRSAMREDSDLASASMTALVEKMVLSAANIKDMSATTEQSLVSLGNNITQQSSLLASAMGQISERQQSLTSSLDSQRDVINGLLNRLTLAQDETAAMADKTSSRLADGAQKITSQIESMDARAQSALSNMKEATEAFAKEAAAIDAQAKQAEQQAQEIVSSATSLHSQIYDLRTSMQYDGERTKEVMNDMLVRVASGSGEIREAGVVTEKAIASVQKVLAEQIGELSTSITSMTERQDALSTALSAQRETIDVMLCKFIDVQNATALVAENTAACLVDGTSRMTESMEKMGAQAGSTLASVQNSVSGFAEQAALLNRQGQQAEQQARSVVAATSDMQEHARHLREAMQAETSAVVERLSAVITRLDVASQQLKSNGNDASQILDAAAISFSSATEAGVDQLRKQAEVMSSVADQSEAKINSVNDALRGQLKLVADAGVKAEDQSKHLADSVEFSTTRLAALRDSIDASEKSGREVVDLTSNRIEEVKNALQEQLQQLTSFSKQTIEQVSSAAQALAAQSESLRSNISASESALSDAAGLVREETRHLPAVLGRGVADIEAAAESIKNVSADSNKALIGTADRFISVTAAARSNMADEMQKVSQVADEAGKILIGFNQLLAEQVAAMQQGAAMLSSEQNDLVMKASVGVDSLADASNRLATLRSEASATAERLVREFDMLDQRAASTGGRLSQAGEGIVKQVEAITSATAKAEAQLCSTGESLRDQMERIRSGLQSQIEDVSRGLTQITSQLERTGSTLRSTTVGAVSDVERVGQRFEQTSSGAVAQINAATEETSKLLNGFGEKFDAIMEHMARAGMDIKSQEGNAIEGLQNMLAHLGVVAEKLETARSMSGDISRHAIERLDEVVTAVQAQMSNMTAGAQTAAGIMRGIGQIYNDQTSSLSKGVSEAHGQVMSMNRSIDEMQQRADRMRMALKLQGDELMNSLRQILTQLEMTGDGLSEAVSNTLMQQAAAGTKKLV